MDKTFVNFRKACRALERAVLRTDYDELEMAGVIQTYMFTFELSWKFLRKLIEKKGGDVSFAPTDVLLKAFEYELISEIESNILKQALQTRNKMAHTYNKEQSLEVIELIKNFYAPTLLTIEKNTQSEI